MAENIAKCGSKTIRYPSSCSYSCSCRANGPCTWTVKCGGTVFTGTGLTLSPGEPGGGGHPKGPQVTIDGNLLVLSQMLQEIWKRRVIVPVNLRNRKIRKRTLKGTPEEMAAALGVKLGAKVKGKTKTQMVSVK